MIELQRILAVPMALSALACLWLLYRLAGADAALGGLLCSVALIAVLIAFGRGQRGGRTLGALVAGVALMVATFAVITAPKPQTGGTRAVAGAEAWSGSRVASYVQQGKPAFVYFTADWCLTCKANEIAAIDRDEVRAAFKSAGVKVLAGDWTNGDPEITRFLETRGRAGVPLYLWYEPGGNVEELPQILTPSMLTDRARRPRR
jgi:thiol:disulfide interchange protein